MLTEVHESGYRSPIRSDSGVRVASSRGPEDERTSQMGPKGPVKSLPASIHCIHTWPLE